MNWLRRRRVERIVQQLHDTFGPETLSESLATVEQAVESLAADSGSLRVFRTPVAQLHTLLCRYDPAQQAYPELWIVEGVVRQADDDRAGDGLALLRHDVLELALRQLELIMYNEDNGELELLALKMRRRIGAHQAREQAKAHSAVVEPFVPTPEVVDFLPTEPMGWVDSNFGTRGARRDFLPTQPFPLQDSADKNPLLHIVGGA